MTLRSFAVLLAAVLAGCAAHGSPAPPPAAAVDAAVVHDLGGLGDLAARFDRDRAHPRVVLLLSPT